MKKWVRENYTIEKTFSCWGRNFPYNDIFIDKNIEVSSCLDEDDILTYLPQLVKALFELYGEQLKKKEKKEKKKEISANWNGKLD